MEDQNPKENLTPQQELPQEEAAPAQEQEGYLFFNVMPQSKDSEHMVAPSLKIAKEEPKEPVPVKKGFSFGEFFGKNKLYFILILLVVIGAPIVYIVADKVGKNSVTSEDFLVKNPSGNKVQSAESTSTPAQATSTGFTTLSDFITK
jgi:hypothetical protein